MLPRVRHYISSDVVAMFDDKTWQQMRDEGAAQR